MKTGSHLLIASSLSLLRIRLTQLSAHLVVALVALVVIGGATRVMEAGLACPDWPLCFGSLLPGNHMNIQVFLEWFHRLDAFVIGIALILQFSFSFIWREQLPNWLPWLYGFLVILVVFQGALGALTVMNLLQTGVVTAHLAIALTLVGIMSGLTQILRMPGGLVAPVWWRLMAGISLVAVFGQCLLGARMATSWGAQRCLQNGEQCLWLHLHRNSAIPVSVCLFIFVLTALRSAGWPRSQWPFLLALVSLLIMQISLGFLSIHFRLSQPILTVSHQLLASLLVAVLSALICRRQPSYSPEITEITQQSLLETCHG